MRPLPFLVLCEKTSATDAFDGRLMTVSDIGALSLVTEYVFFLLVLLFTILKQHCVGIQCLKILLEGILEVMKSHLRSQQGKQSYDKPRQI